MLRIRPPGGVGRWQRTNYAGRSVSLLGGAAVACACTLVPLLSVLPRHGLPASSAAGAAVVAAAGGAMGALDDLGEDTASASKGLRGHLSALARGQVTTGALKIAGIGAGALAAATLLTPRSGSRVGDAVEVMAGTVLVAGTANLHNLFDLRPGRALKVAAGVSGALTAGGVRARSASTSAGTTVAGTTVVPTTAVRNAPVTTTLAATALGVACAALPQDLAERTMLGDTGANAVGGLVGAALAAHPSRGVRASALATVLTLTLLSEKVSFSQVIASTPGLRELDAWGRR